MSIGAKEKALVNIYKDAAGLREMEYRQLLLACSGCESLRDEMFDAVHFRAVMARLETLLFTRVSDGLIPNPRGHNVYIRSETYWRDQARKVDPPGRITSAQLARINNLLAHLQQPMGTNYTAEYIAGIFARAIGRKVFELSDISNADASRIIDALQDKPKTRDGQQ